MPIMAETVARPSRIDTYQPAPGVFDELRAADGVRPHWEKLVAALDALGPQEWAHRWEQARRMIREHGVTYHVHGEPTGLDRPWELDSMPFVLPPADWLTIHDGIAQRARLLN